MVNGALNSELYLDFLRDYVIPYAESQFPMSDYGSNNFYMLHDNAPIHNLRIVTQFIASYMPGRLIQHPPYSPDLNPIENLGNEFKTIFRKYIIVWTVN